MSSGKSQGVGQLGIPQISQMRDHMMLDFFGDSTLDKVKEIHVGLGANHQSLCAPTLIQVSGISNKIQIS